MKTASGGIFAELAEKIILSNGVVYGTVINLQKEKYHVFCDRAQTIEELDPMYGSKYVYSYYGDIYQKIKQDLENGKEVLLSGTPCQIAGIKSYLGKEYDNLLTVDIICHGVPDIQLFKDYLNYLEAKKKVEIHKFVFRDKTNGWGTNGKICFSTKKGINKEKTFLGKESSYYYYFLKGEIYRENCYQCPYAKKERVGDLTIGDFWGVEKEEPQYNEREIRNGVSCILVNNKKGDDKLKKYGNNLKMTETELDKIMKWNDQLSHPVKQKSNKILQLYKKKGYKKVQQYYLKSIGWKIIIKKALGCLK